MEKKRIITISIYSILILVLSYFAFMAFQGLLTIVSKEGEIILPILGVALNIFAIPSIVVAGYHYFFKKTESKRKFLLKNGIYLTVSGGITSILMIIAVAGWKNWGLGGPTPWYPVDFLVLDLLITAAGVYTLVLSRKEEKKESEKETFKDVLFKAGKYIFVFMALDRMGAFIKSICNGLSTFDVLILIYLLLLAPMVGLVFNALYKVSKNDKLKSRYWLIGSSVSLGLSLIGTIYIVVMLFGDLATPFMKVMSSFYGLDRISSLPITLAATSLISIITPLVYLINWFRKNKKIDNKDIA